jgi:predicted metal-dependent hydrolase
MTVRRRRYGARVAEFDNAPGSSPSGGAAALRAATNVEVRRSARRRRTISAYREGDRTIVLLPARMSRAEEARWVDVMLERLEKQERRSAGRAARGDADLGKRAEELSRQFLGGVPKPASVRWVSNQGSRWGSCTPVDGTIRLSDRMATMPSWVIDYVLVHELAHLIEFGHGPRFHLLVDAFPKAERARGYLLGVIDGAGWAGETGESAGSAAALAAGGDDDLEVSDVDEVDDRSDHGDGVSDGDEPAAGGLW